MRHSNMFDVFMALLELILFMGTVAAHSLPGVDITNTVSPFAGNDFSNIHTSNISLHSHRTACKSPAILDPTNSDAIIACHCYAGFSQDRFYLIAAIERFCASTDSVIWSGTASGGSQEVSASYWYNKDNTIEGITTILIKQGWWAPQMGTQAQCDPEFTIDYNTCLNSMHVPIDQCDTDAENGKHGGQAASGCILWSVDADPRYNDLETFSQLDMPDSVWPTPPARL